MSDELLLQVKDLRTSFFTANGVVRAVRGVSFCVGEGEIVGMVGESACGKTVTALSILDLIRPPGRVLSGEVIFRGRDLRTLGKRQLRHIRGEEIGMVFQNPIPSLNPIFTIGRQLTEALKAHGNVSDAEAADRAAELLDLVGISAPRQRMSQYPHQFSGGMAQRVMIAMMLTCRPSLLIADEPTTALDVTIQAQVLELLQRLNKRLGMAVLLVTHNFALVADVCERTLVMYAGQIVESGTTEEVFQRHHHPYTDALLKCIPELDTQKQSLVPLEGYPPDPRVELKTCAFYPRCSRRFGRCEEGRPATVELDGGHQVRCWLYH